jgi:hypothetical protein
VSGAFGKCLSTRGGENGLLHRCPEETDTQCPSAGLRAEDTASAPGDAGEGRSTAGKLPQLRHPSLPPRPCKPRSPCHATHGRVSRFPEGSATASLPPSRGHGKNGGWGERRQGPSILNCFPLEWESGAYSNFFSAAPWEKQAKPHARLETNPLHICKRGGGCGGGDNRLEGSNLVQTKQSHTRLCKSAAPTTTNHHSRRPSVPPGECTWQWAALPCRRTRTNTHPKLWERLGVSSTAEATSLCRPSAWSRRQLGDKPEAPCEKGEGAQSSPGPRSW